MNASGLNRRIVLLTNIPVKQPTGERKNTWVALAILWAEKLFLTSRDVAREAGVQASSEAKFRIRYRINVDTAMRLVCDGRTYAINGLEEIGHREGWYLLVREVSGA